MMELSEVVSSTRCGLVVALVTLLAAAGCSSPNSGPATGSGVRVMGLNRAVDAPVWSKDRETVLALVHGGSRVAEISPSKTGPPDFTMSSALDDTGRNVVTDPTGDDAVFVPQPRKDRIVELGLPNLRKKAVLDLGRSPSQVAVDSGSRTLLALSEDGTRISGMRLRTGETLPTRRSSGGPTAELDGPNRGRLIDYHVLGPKGVSHYKGAQDEVERVGTLAIPVRTAASDKAKTSRLYVAEQGTNKLRAVDTTRSQDGLEIVATSRFDEPIEALATDDLRIYAVTQHRLLVLAANNVQGFGDGALRVVKRVPYRRALHGAKVKHAAPSGIAVGDERVYLTLRGEPYMVSIDKPAM